MICSNCGKDFNDDFDFCPYCGERAPKIKICSNCGFESLESSFCPKCGIKLTLKTEIIDPKNIYQYINKGDDLCDLGRYEEAIMYYDKAIEIQSKNAYLYNNKGYCLEQINQYEDAINCYNKAIKLDPANEYSYNHKRHCLEQLNEINCKKNSFKYLYKLIQSKQKEIILNEDIMLQENEENLFPDGIIINTNNLVIEGNGHSIDAKNKTKIFENYGKNVIIKNIILKNGFNKNKRLNGIACGAIYNNKTLTIIDSILINNNADYKGGAILNEGRLIIERSVFEENMTRGNGGAIYNDNGKLTIKSTEFRKNNAEYQGGAIWINNNDSVTINDCIFLNNNAKYGETIYNKGKLSIETSTFEKNAVIHNGTIYNDNGDLTIKNTIFEDKKYRHIYTKELNNVKLEKCNLEEKNIFID